MNKKIFLTVSAVLASLLIGCGQTPQGETITATVTQSSDTQTGTVIEESESKGTATEQIPQIETENFRIWVNNKVESMDIAYSKFNLETDYQYQNIHCYEGVSTVTNAPNGYYTKIANFLYYWDQDGEQLIPLCNRPDCLHDKETDVTKIEDCNAFCAENYGLCQYNNGEIYTIFDYTRSYKGTNFGEVDITSHTLDGSERNFVTEIKSRYSRFLCIHRGYVYYHQLIPSQKRGVWSRQTIYRMPIEGGKQETIMWVESLEWSSRAEILPYGDNVYINIRPYEFEIDAGYLVIYDINSTEAVAHELPKSISRILPEGEKLIYFQDYQNILESDLSASEIREVGTFEGPKTRLGGNTIGADEKYYYYEGIDMDSQTQISKLIIYDRATMKKVKEEVLPEVSYAQRMGADDEYLYLISGEYPDSPTGFWYVKKADYIAGTGEFKQLLKKEYIYE